MQCNKSAINHINTKTLRVHFAVKWKKGKSMISFAQASGVIKTLFCALFLFSTLHITLSIFLQFYTVVLVILSFFIAFCTFHFCCGILKLIIFSLKILMIHIRTIGFIGHGEFSVVILIVSMKIIRNSSHSKKP